MAAALAVLDSSAYPDAHVAKVKAFADAGFDHVHVHQVGADQETFFRFYEREALPRLRRSLKGAPRCRR